MAKFPFTHFFDRNGNGQMDFTEELLAMKVFEDALPGEEPASCDETENDGLDGLDDGLSDEIDEEGTDSLIDPDMTLHSPDFADDGSDEIDLEDINSLIDQDLGLHSPDFFEDDLDEDDIWDDLEEDEDVWDDSQEAEEEPVAYLSLSWESREDRFAKQGVRREDYPSQRAYDAACDLIDLQNGKGYVPSASTRQREIERRQFLVEGGCVAARYLTIHDGFLYAQAVKENFPLPISVPDEDERPATSLDELFLDLAEEDPALAVRVWAWIIKEFGPYPQYMDGVWMPFNGLLHITDQFPPAFQELALEELCQNSDFRRGLLEASPEFPDAGGYIAYALSHGREDQAATLLKSALKNPHGKGVLYEELVKDMMSHMIEGRDPEPWEALERTVFPILEGLPDKRTQRLLPQWKEEVAQRIQWRRPRPAPQPPQYADPLAATDKTVYTFCGVRFPGWQRVYYYRTDDETLAVGDQVLVPGRDGPTPAEVVSIQKHRRDTAPYDLIMKNKELLLDRDPKRSPVRFIFSHSALREGWDNPNVFQICTLKQSSSEVRKRQEVGRGLRLCVNQDGERMDANVLGNDVHGVNVLTVIASESYDSFAKGLQSELADAVAGRPVAVTADLFKGKVLVDASGNEQVVDDELAQAIHFDLIVNGYIDRKGALTDKYYADKANGEIKVAEEVSDSRDAVLNILDSVYDSRTMQPENARDKNVELQVNPEKLAMPEFKALWQRISPKSVYVVDFDTDELVRKAVAALNRNLRVSKVFFKVETGAMEEIKSRDELLEGSAFSKSRSSTYDSSKRIRTNHSVKYDLIGKLVGETGLTRKAVVEILTGIEKAVFDQFKDNPEEFIIKAAGLINDEKATAIIQHITYNMLEERYDTDIFTEPTIKGKLGANAMKAQRHLYDHIVYDSTNERDFVSDLDTNEDVAVYVKLPDSFYISTPVGHYNPDWAIAFYEGSVKHIYFVAETKGSMSSMQLRQIEESKIHCAREHFKAISGENVVYDVVDSYQALLEKVMK